MIIKEHKIYDHIMPALSDWPITRFSKDRDAFIERLIKYTMDRLDQSNHKPEELLSKSIYLEQQRVKNNPWNVDPGDEKMYWKSLLKELDATVHAEDPELERRKLLRRIVYRYSEEIIGFFIPKTYLFARKFLGSFFKRLFNNGWGRGHRGIWGNKNDLRKKIKIDGYVEELRELFNHGTVVIVPTHYSNLDSIMIGYGIDANVGVPAFSYGAGLNLYDYEVLAYFMNRLGAYRVDRRKKNPIYLETLKSMASLSLIEGLNHIFFPGGTRSRSGAIENKLKLGLLNSVIDAQRYCMLKEMPQKIFVIPLTLGYHFVLEGGGLIHQHLRITGREKYHKGASRKSTFSSVFRFLRTLRKTDSEVYLSFGKPMDVLGNYVDNNGKSFDDRGNEIDISKYFATGDTINIDPQRESVYTRILAERIVSSFKSENIVLSSHLCAYAAFRILRADNPELDLFEVLRIPVKSFQINIDRFKQECNVVIEELKSIRDIDVKFSEIFSKDLEAIIKDGISKIGVYHSKKVLKWVGESLIVSEDFKLLYYYHNKLTHYELDSEEISQS
jgi:glycerol-3-phosphate O-acyltransferase